MAPWTSVAAYELYTSVAVTPAPAWVLTQWLLVPNFTSVVGKAENFSPCLYAAADSLGVMGSNQNNFIIPIM